MTHTRNIENRTSRLTQKYVSRLIREARNKFNIPAIAITAMNSDSIYLQNSIGTRVYKTENPVTLQDYFHIGSCSKLVLAAIAGKMIETGKINWKTTFFDIYPELKEQANAGYYGITLEDLFLCEAGIMPFTSGGEIFPDIDSSKKEQRLEFIRYLLKQEPSSKQKINGKYEHRYSNAGYTMASAMLEKVSGKTYEELIVLYVADEMGFDVHIGWPNNNGTEQPWGHTIAAHEVQAFPPGHEYQIPFLITPAGDLSMTPIDYARFIQMNLKGLLKIDNFVSSKMYDYLHFGHTGFSLGVANGRLGGIQFSGTDGSAGTFFCRAILVPESDFAFTIMMNAGSDTGEMKAADWLTMQIVKEYYNWWWKFWL